MKPEEQRIAIAEACGWKHNNGEKPNYGGTYRQAGWTSPNGVFIASTWETKTASGIPDYLNDLNACHEMETVLTREQQKVYEVVLREVVSGKSGFWYVPHACEVFAVAHATAAQRAESFLRTIGKWKEGV